MPPRNQKELKGPGVLSDSDQSSETYLADLEAEYIKTQSLLGQMTKKSEDSKIKLQELTNASVAAAENGQKGQKEPTLVDAFSLMADLAKTVADLKMQSIGEQRPPSRVVDPTIIPQNLQPNGVSQQIGNELRHNVTSTIAPNVAPAFPQVSAGVNVQATAVGPSTSHPLSSSSSLPSASITAPADILDQESVAQAIRKILNPNKTQTGKE